MMREILFRGKRISNGAWVEGFYCKHDTVKVCFTTDDPKSKHLIILDGFCDWGFEPPLLGVEVDPATIGQYTGLTDKNGVRIFEGDILCFVNDDAEESLYICLWSCSDSSWVVHYSPTDSFDTLDELFCAYANVIGNIHDNPELLSKESEV